MPIEKYKNVVGMSSSYHYDYDNRFAGIRFNSSLSSDFRTDRVYSSGNNYGASIGYDKYNNGMSTSFTAKSSTSSSASATSSNLRDSINGIESKRNYRSAVYSNQPAPARRCISYGSGFMNTVAKESNSGIDYRKSRYSRGESSFGTNNKSASTNQSSSRNSVERTFQMISQKYGDKPYPPRTIGYGNILSKDSFPAVQNDVKVKRPTYPIFMDRNLMDSNRLTPENSDKSKHRKPKDSVDPTESNRLNSDFMEPNKLKSDSADSNRLKLKNSLNSTRLKLKESMDSNRPKPKDSLDSIHLPCSSSASIKDPESEDEDQKEVSHVKSKIDRNNVNLVSEYATITDHLESKINENNQLNKNPTNEKQRLASIDRLNLPLVLITQASLPGSDDENADQVCASIYIPRDNSTDEKSGQKNYEENSTENEEEDGEEKEEEEEYESNWSPISRHPQIFTSNNSDGDLIMVTPSTSASLISVTTDLSDEFELPFVVADAAQKSAASRGRVSQSNSLPAPIFTASISYDGMDTAWDEEPAKEDELFESSLSMEEEEAVLMLDQSNFTITDENMDCTLTLVEQAALRDHDEDEDNTYSSDFEDEEYYNDEEFEYSDGDEEDEDQNEDENNEGIHNESEEETNSKSLSAELTVTINEELTNHNQNEDSEKSMSAESTVEKFISSETQPNCIEMNCKNTANIEINFGEEISAIGSDVVESKKNGEGVLKELNPSHENEANYRLLTASYASIESAEFDEEQLDENNVNDAIASENKPIENRLELLQVQKSVEIDDRKSVDRVTTYAQPLSEAFIEECAKHLGTFDAQPASDFARKAVVKPACSEHADVHIIHTEPPLINPPDSHLNSLKPTPDEEDKSAVRKSVLNMTAEERKRVEKQEKDDSKQKSRRLGTVNAISERFNVGTGWEETSKNTNSNREALNEMRTPQRTFAPIVNPVIDDNFEKQMAELRAQIKTKENQLQNEYRTLSRGIHSKQDEVKIRAMEEEHRLRMGSASRAFSKAEDEKQRWREARKIGVEKRNTNENEKRKISNEKLESNVTQASKKVVGRNFTVRRVRKIELNSKDQAEIDSNENQYSARRPSTTTVPIRNTKETVAVTGSNTYKDSKPTNRRASRRKTEELINYSDSGENAKVKKPTTMENKDEESDIDKKIPPTKKRKRHLKRLRHPFTCHIHDIDILLGWSGHDTFEKMDSFFTSEKAAIHNMPIKVNQKRAGSKKIWISELRDIDKLYKSSELRDIRLSIEEYI